MKIDQDKLRTLAQDIFISRLSNSERYKGIAFKILHGELTQKEAALKEVKESWILAETFLKYKHKDEVSV